MAITFTDEDLMYLDKDQDDKLRSMRQSIDSLKEKAIQHSASAVM